MSGGIRLSFDLSRSRFRLSPVRIDPRTGHVLVPGHEQSRFRTKRFNQFLTMVDAILARQGICRIIDLGGTPTYWAAFAQELQRRDVRITVVNLLPQVSDSPQITSIVGDATDLADCASMSFDIVHSNSVIEHVGSWARMEAFAHEVRRLAPAFFVQTPNFWFPFDPHARTLFFHWLPIRARITLLMRRRCGFYPQAASLEEALLHVHEADSLSWSQMRKLFRDAEIKRERLFGLTKSLMAVREARARISAPSTGASII